MAVRAPTRCGSKDWTPGDGSRRQKLTGAKFGISENDLDAARVEDVHSLVKVEALWPTTHHESQEEASSRLADFMTQPTARAHLFPVLR